MNKQSSKRVSKFKEKTFNLPAGSVVADDGSLIVHPCVVHTATLKTRKEINTQEASYDLAGQIHIYRRLYGGIC